MDECVENPNKDFSKKRKKERVYSHYFTTIPNRTGDHVDFAVTIVIFCLLCYYWHWWWHYDSEIVKYVTHIYWHSHSN